MGIWGLPAPLLWNFVAERWNVDSIDSCHIFSTSRILAIEIVDVDFVLTGDTVPLRNWQE